MEHGTNMPGHEGEGATSLPFYPDGIEPSSALAAILEDERDQRMALCLIVLQTVAAAIERRDPRMTLWRLRTPGHRDGSDKERWLQIALAATKAGLGSNGCLGEVAGLWEVEPEVAEVLLQRHRERMTWVGAFFEYKNDGHAVAKEVMEALNGGGLA